CYTFNTNFFCHISWLRCILLFVFRTLPFVMKQHQVILSIGSNKGNRLYNIESCIDLIHKEVATVVKTSKLYETPSWGFQGEAFYNCAILIHTYKKPEVILSEILEIEKELGRIRSKSGVYEDR